MRAITSKCLIVAVLLSLVLCTSPLSAAQPLRSVGYVTIELQGVGAILGVSWGRGTLYFRGKRYPIRVEGLALGDVGYAKMSARGKVYNMRRPLDITGTYGAMGAGIALAGGVAGLAMQNERGVVIDLSATQQGLKLNIGPQGLTITMR